MAGRTLTAVGRGFAFPTYNVPRPQLRLVTARPTGWGGATRLKQRNGLAAENPGHERKDTVPEAGKVDEWRATLLLRR